MIEPEELLTPGEVATLLGVDPRTVARWADSERLPAVRTLGGHRRFKRSGVRTFQLYRGSDRR